MNILRFGDDHLTVRLARLSWMDVQSLKPHRSIEDNKSAARNARLGVEWLSFGIEVEDVHRLTGRVTGQFHFEVLIINKADHGTPALHHPRRTMIVERVNPLLFEQRHID